jgi:hypothetical protein
MTLGQPRQEDMMERLRLRGVIDSEVAQFRPQAAARSPATPPTSSCLCGWRGRAQSEAELNSTGCPERAWMGSTSFSFTTSGIGSDDQ